MLDDVRELDTILAVGLDPIHGIIGRLQQLLDGRNDVRQRRNAGRPEQTAFSSSSGSRQVASSAGAPIASSLTTAQLGAGNQAAARLTSASATGPGSSGVATCRVISLNGSTRLR